MSERRGRDHRVVSDISLAKATEWVAMLGDHCTQQGCQGCSEMCLLTRALPPSIAAATRCRPSGALQPSALSTVKQVEKAAGPAATDMC